jgi:ABC-type Na+ efflux pump permease subunit
LIYKEWLALRPKLFMMTLFFGVVALLVSTVWAPNPYGYDGPLYNRWLIAALLLTLLVAVLGGVDAVAEESDKGTIGFLLTRPISRLKIYITKLLLSGPALALTLFLSSFIMFFVDHIPREHVTYTYLSNPTCTPDGQFVPIPPANVVTNSLPNDVISRWDAVTAIGVIFLIGLTLLCLSALVSVFARTTIQAIVLTMMVVLVIGFILTNLNNNYFRLSVNPQIFGQPLVPGLTFSLGAIFFLAGLFSFRRRDF